MVRESAGGRAVIMMFGCAALLGAATASSQAPSRPAALALIEAGLWEVRADGEPQRNICVAGADALIQLRHRMAGCSQLVVADEKMVTTIQYSCPGAGWGRTTLRVQNGRAARIDTQGIADRRPFAFVAEARRIGECGGSGRIPR